MEYKKYVVQDGDFEICVHNDFHVKNPDIKIETTEFYELITKNGLAPYFHNPNGPAITHLKTGKKNYYINGKALTPEQIDKIEHNIAFNTDLTEMIQTKE